MAEGIDNIKYECDEPQGAFIGEDIKFECDDPEFTIVTLPQVPDNTTRNYQLEELLHKFNLPEVKFYLTKAGITYESLRYLSKEDIKEAIAPIGLRAQFREKLFSWRNNELNSPISKDDAEALKDLLTEWDLQHIHAHLIAQHITVGILKDLTTKHIDLLFHGLPVGDLTNFEINLETWKLLSNNGDNVSKLPKTVARSVFNEDVHKLVKEPICSVMDMLLETKNGRLILQYYSRNKILHEEQRNMVINTLAKYIESKGVACSLSDCTEMEKQICKIFPTESLDYYSNGKRGKLYNKVYNLKRLSKNLLDEKETTSTGSESTAFVPEPDAEFALQCIRSKNVTEEEFEMFWKKCSQLRFCQMSDSKSTQEILKLWTEYSRPTGYKLIEIDFSLKYPQANDFKSKWSLYERKLLHVMKTKIASSFICKQLTELETCDEESKIFSIFWNLHHLFPPQATVVTEENGAKRRKKYSVSDSQNAFAIVAQTNAELDLKVNLRKLQCRTVQPLLLIVGDISMVKEIYICLDGIKYQIAKVLNAVDILYKIFFVFNIEFPEESIIYFNFLQTFFYEMKSDKKFSKICSIKNEILNLRLD